MSELIISARFDDGDADVDVRPRARRVSFYVRTYARTLGASSNLITLNSKHFFGSLACVHHAHRASFSTLDLTMEGRFATERLVVEPWNDEFSASDLEELANILDEDVTAFLPDSLHYCSGETDVSEWARTFSSGNNKVSSVRLQNSELVGLLLLMNPLDSSEDVHHLGYIFGKRYWGQGYATELLNGLVRQLTEDGYKGEVRAGVAKGNPASTKVLQKVGFESHQPNDKSQPDIEWYRRSFTCGSR